MVKNDQDSLLFCLSKLCCTSGPSNCTSSGCARNHSCSLIHTWRLLGRRSKDAVIFHAFDNQWISSQTVQYSSWGGLSSAQTCSETRTLTAAALREESNIVWHCGTEGTTSSSHLVKYCSSGRTGISSSLQKKLHQGCTYQYSSSCGLFQAWQSVNHMNEMSFVKNLSLF